MNVKTERSQFKLMVYFYPSYIILACVWVLYRLWTMTTVSDLVSVFFLTIFILTNTIFYVFLLDREKRTKRGSEE